MGKFEPMCKYDYDCATFSFQIHLKFDLYRLEFPQGGQNKQGQTPKKSGEDDSTSARLQRNLGEPLPGNKR